MLRGEEVSNRETLPGSGARMTGQWRHTQDGRHDGQAGVRLGAVGVADAQHAQRRQPHRVLVRHLVTAGAGAVLLRQWHRAKSQSGRALESRFGLVERGSAGSNRWKFEVTW